ncbi:hypothetical protein HMI56_000917 [Coelomomyces lativittatus]|nr:hypothetical protein HMI56_000917 [Coelomomyces lativittatus]
MDSYEPNSPPILQIRAYFGNKEHVFILQNPLHSSLRQFKEDLFELFIPHLSSKEDVSNFELKYLESSYLLPLENQEQFQNAMKYAQTQQPAFLHIFCSKQGNTTSIYVKLH